MPILPVKGRGVPNDPPNRFERVHLEPDPKHWGDTRPDTEFITDKSTSIVARNTSPDIPFDASVNPYRGCEHGCVYCYARPTHEYLGFSSGLDFERRILVKRQAPELLRRALSSPSWVPRVVAMSGVTDPYQPVERHLRLTRGCLAVFRDFRNPVTIITKNHLVTRDKDILADLARDDCARVTLSVTTLRRDLHRIMEPRTSIPSKRLDAVSTLADAGIPVSVFIAPLIPGLTDEEAPDIVEAAARAGATSVSFLLLRLPGAVADHFVDWLGVHFPDRKKKILARVRESHGGTLNDGAFHRRFRGQGAYADQLKALVRTVVRRAGMDTQPKPLATNRFKRVQSAQTDLFGD